MGGSGGAGSAVEAEFSQHASLSLSQGHEDTKGNLLEHSGSHSGDSGAEQGVVGWKDEIKLLGARLWEGKQGRRGKGRGMRARAGRSCTSEAQRAETEGS